MVLCQINALFSLEKEHQVQSFCFEGIKDCALKVKFDVYMHVFKAFLFFTFIMCQYSLNLLIY